MPLKHTNVCFQNLGDDTAEKELNPIIIINHLPIIQRALIMAKPPLFLPTRLFWDVSVSELSTCGVDVASSFDS